jgi:hypothetical protein
MTTTVNIIDTLIGKTPVSVQHNQDYDQVEFSFSDGSRFVLLHIQDCCETVEIKQIDGDLDDLSGAEIIMAEVVTNIDDDVVDQWTFYKFATNKGYVTISWSGTLAHQEIQYSLEVSEVWYDKDDKEVSRKLRMHPQ